MIKHLASFLIITVFVLWDYSIVQAKPIKVFILCGQSNMQGHANIKTFEAMKTDPLTEPILEEMVDEKGNPIVCDQVWISYCTGSKRMMGEGFGKLTAGFGARRIPHQASEKIGPELTFGIYIQKALKEPVLIIKTAWGGKSLNTDFRPPSAGSDLFKKEALKNLKKRGKNIEEVKAEKAYKTGHFYHLMIEHIGKVLKDIKRVYPDYKNNHGYDLAGFLWFQGWNDMIDTATYPNRNKSGGYKAYSECLVHFIRNVRRDLNAPYMKFVIGVMGIGGILEKDKKPHMKFFREAMIAPTLLPEFKDNVVAVETASFWDRRLQEIEEKKIKIEKMEVFLRNKHQNYPNKDGSMDFQAQKSYLDKYYQELITKEDDSYVKIARSNGAYHYFGSAKIMAQIGKAFAEAMITKP